ncbi:MAG: glycosyltransferase [Bacteroidia bacterium]|nr:glycosyltransferase [Bacteroidia bacterium]
MKDVVKDDDGERIWKELQTETATKLDISFTGVITQKQVDEVLINASFLIYPPEFPETYGISTLEALYYGVIPITSVYGALEQTAIDDLSFKLPYPVLPGDTNQIRKFVNLVVQAYQDTYRCDQKRQAAEAVREISSWETVAKQWKAHFYRKFNLLLPKAETEEVRQITSIVNRLFGTRHINPEDRLEYFPTKEERRLVIISPTWNAEDYIERCIKSVAAQLYENYIHIIIDDVSADKTAAIAEQIVNNLPDSLRSKFLVVKNVKRVGALQNQMTAINQFTEADDIIVLLDGDDSLYNDPDIFNYINEQYPSNEMTYGSCWSMTDGLALIGQEYPEKVRLNKTYRQYRPFPWGIPHTHLRTFDRDLYLRADHNKLLDDDGVPYGPAGDSALMYMLLEEADPYRIKAVKRLMVNYNDMNPLNDYKANTEEQNRNTQKIAGTVPTKTPTAPPESPVVKTRILIGTPTAKYIESETFGSIYNLSVPEHVGTWFECFYGYNIAQIRNLMADYAINHGFDYMLWVDSDIILPRDTLEKMLASGKDIISGLYVQRLPDKTIPEVYIWRGNRLVNADVAELTGEDLISVWGVGFGCVLTKTNVLRDIGYPQFEYKNSLDHANTVSEDVDFCLKARRKGYDIFLDPTIQCKHIGTRIHEVKHV